MLFFSPVIGGPDSPLQLHPQMDCLFLDAGYAAQMERLQILAARAAQDEDVCGVALVAGSPDSEHPRFIRRYGGFPTASIING